MKAKFLLLLLSILRLTSAAQTDLTHLVIQTKDGTKVAYAFTKAPKIAFADDFLILCTDEVNVTYPLIDMEVIKYEACVEAGVKDLKTDELLISFIGDSLLFHTLKANSTVSIYSIGGENVLTRNIHQDGEYSFSLSQLTPGIYLVKIDSLTYKIVKR